MNDYSMICRFALTARDNLTERLIKAAESVFAAMGCNVKKIYASSGEKSRSYGRNEFKRFVNYDYFYSIEFRSDFDRADFEPQTRLYTNIDNSYVRGNPYVKPKPLVKFTVVVRDELLSSKNETFEKIASALSEMSDVPLSGQAFLLPNRFGTVSFSHGIARKINMPEPLQCLLAWERGYDVKKGFVGLFNCFSGLAKKQVELLERLFGKENVKTAGGLAWFVNGDMDTLDIGGYFMSEKYDKLCGELSASLPFERLQSFSFGNQLNKPGVI